ncbi:hypothetical protein ACNOYE_24895 [Nannocystaceae bacterium ST9]
MKLHVTVPALLVGLVLACEAEIETVPEGALARVGAEVIEPEQVEQTHAQLGAFGQARFRGVEGRRALIDAVIVEELLVQIARDEGLAVDPRVRFAVLEELAELQRAAMLERRLPRAEIAADTAALRARHALERTSFATPERRRLRAVRFDTWEAADAALARLLAGEAELGDLGEVLVTVSMKRDDLEHPAFHAVLFDATLAVGDPLPVPVLSGSFVLVGELEAIEPAGVLAFEDPKVQEALVEREWAARLPPIEAELLAELAERFPETAP